MTVIEQTKARGAVACLELAGRLLGEGDPAGAEAAARATVEIAPTSAEARHLLARALQLQGKSGEAGDAATAAIELAPTYAEAYHTRALCRLAKGDPVVAISDVRAAIYHAPHYAEAYFTMGTLLHRARRMAEAEASYRQALSVKPDYVEAMNYLALVLQDWNRLDDAVAMLRQAVGLRPDYTDAHNNLGLVLRQQGKHEEAAASFRTAYDMFEPHLVLCHPESLTRRALCNARRSIRVAADLARWSISGTTRPHAWTDYRLLHQATNGASTDLLNRAMRTVSAIRKTTSEWRDSPIFPWIGPGDIPRIVDALDRDGVFVFDRPLAPELVDEMLTYARSAKAVPVGTAGEAAPVVFDPAAPLAIGYQYDEAEMLERPAFQRFMGDPLLLAVARAYLGVEPKLAYLVMWWSAVFGRNPTSDMAQLFHTDLAHPKWLKTFVYLTDVTEGAGPHSLVRGSHKPDREGRDLRRRGLVRVSDEDIYAAYGRERVIDLVGPRGTVFIADTRAFHKGHLPRTDHRLVLQVYHVNLLYPGVHKARRPFRIEDTALAETARLHPRIFTGYQFTTESGV